LEVAARHADGSPSYTVYRVSNNDSLPYQSLSGVSVDGPLELVGFRLLGTEFHPDAIAELWAVWQVKETSARPLSLMAHLVGPDGVPAAVGDGLGVGLDQWRTGDVIVQRHRFVIPNVSGDFDVQVGAYWLDTMERWLILHGDRQNDHLVLGTMTVLPR
jgi:hypothetical protein